MASSSREGWLRRGSSTFTALRVSPRRAKDRENTTPRNRETAAETLKIIQLMRSWRSL